MPPEKKLIEKLRNKNIKKSELETLLGQFGFKKIRGKGSHAVWGKKEYVDIHIVIASHTKEVPLYQLRQIENSLKKRGLL